MTLSHQEQLRQALFLAGMRASGYTEAELEAMSFALIQGGRDRREGKPRTAPPWVAGAPAIGSWEQGWDEADRGAPPEARSRPLAEIAIHVPGEPKGLLQTCVRCGYVLHDYRNTMAPAGSGPLGFWRPGRLVVVEETPYVRATTILKVDDRPLPPLCIRVLDSWGGPLLGTCLHCGRYPAQGHAEDCKGAAAEKERLIREHVEGVQS